MGFSYRTHASDAHTLSKPSLARGSLARGSLRPPSGSSASTADGAGPDSRLRRLLEVTACNIAGLHGGEMHIVH